MSTWISWDQAAPGVMVEIVDEQRASAVEGLPLDDGRRSARGSAPAMVSDYDRSTTATSLEGLPDPIREAIIAHAQARMITLQPAAHAFVTHSRRVRKPGLLARMTGSGDKDTEHLTAVVIGARELLVGTYGELRGTTVLSTRLEDVGLDSLSLAPAGDGMSVSGFASSVEGQARAGSFYVGLGEPAGDDAREALRDAVRLAKAA